jgi:hypothetical protein
MSNMDLFDCDELLDFQNSSFQPIIIEGGLDLDTVALELADIELHRNNTREYRQHAIKRWKEKRSRRCFRKTIICKKRQLVSITRHRVGGRFVTSSQKPMIPITCLMNNLYENNNVDNKEDNNN